MTTDTDCLFQITLVVDKENAEAFADALGVICESISWTDREEDSQATINAFAQHQPERSALEAALAVIALSLNIPTPDFDISQIAVRNWLADNIKQFPPLSAGRFFIYSAEFDGLVPMGKIGLRVPAGIAFGSGDHGSTKGCLLAIDGLKDKTVTRALDMGCGSGILALAMAKRWPVQIVASDLDPDSVTVTRENAAQNGVAHLIHAVHGTGYAHAAVRRNRYDLIVSNILARPLTRLAAELSRHLAPGGTVVLSGLLERDGTRVLSAHRQQGLFLKSRFRVDGWLTLVLQKRGA